MGLFDKLRQAKKPATETRSGKDPNLIQVFDKSATPLYLTKEEWRTKVLPGMLSARWDNPDELYQVIVDTLQDGLPADVADAAEHLYRIDTNHSRAVCAWANVLMGMRRIDKAEQVLKSHIGQYREEGYVVTNLAKVHATRNENDQAEAILWHALELALSKQAEIPLRVSGAAVFLGVSPQTVYFWVERKQIPYLRVMGRNIRFLKSELEPFRAQFKQEVVNWQDQ